MKLNDQQKGIFTEEAIALFGNPYLEERFAGFQSILHRLINEGHILTVAESLITEHFLAFPYFQVMPSEEAVGCVTITFDQEGFFKNDHFQDEVQKRILNEQKIIAAHSRQIETLHSMLLTY